MIYSMGNIPRQKAQQEINRSLLGNQSRKDTFMFTNIKRITATFLLLLGVLMLLSFAVQAQPQRISVEEHMKILKDKLKLNNEQSKKIATILEDQREEITTAMNDNRNDRQAMDAEVQKITKRTDNKIKEVLTEKQVKAYDKVIKDRQTKVSRRMKESN